MKNTMNTYKPVNITFINSHYTTIVIGAGQAGLSMSYYLKKNNMKHIVLEKSDTIASAWRHQR